MLQELFDLVKGHATETVVNNPDIPNEQNSEIIAEATNTVASGLRNVVAGGGVQSIISMFQGGGSQQGQEKSGLSSLMSNPIVSMMVGHFASKLMSKYKLGGSQANGVASSLIPSVISGLISKSGDSGNSGFSLQNLLGSITGNKAGGGGLDIGSLISQFTGGGQQASSGGGGGLMDIVSQLAGGAQQQQQKNGGGGLMDLIKGFL